ncbi:hypothetical protein BKA66DRAFT_521153 [Pyrenochaeta sp. MPI-SDFR-AT-0127]|nr:hypothetical protein BKA66DRAFT_521153 [Pyrenochaeta sp. MPI-SDFR-AT-0127]
MASIGEMPPQMAHHGPPYPPMVWTLGGPPIKRVDIPAQSVFLFFFLVGGIVHMKIFKGNRARGHKFLPNLFIFVFCMSRIITSVLRIASTCLPNNVRLAIAAQIFVSAGVLILFVINLIFVTRLVRSTHPSFGWHPIFSIAFKMMYGIVGLTMAAVITATVQTFYTINPNIRAVDRSLQLYGSTFLAVIATLPLPITILACLIPYSPLDRFGTGRLRTKVIALLVSTTLLSLGAWYRCGATWQTPTPRTQPLPGYLAKGPFYVFNFLVEIQTVLMYAILRVDQRWHIPNGARGPGSYSKPRQGQDGKMQNSSLTIAATHETISDIKASVDHNDDIDTVVNLDFDIEKAQSLPPTPTRDSQPDPQRASRLSKRITRLFTRPSSTVATPEQKRIWRESEQARIIKRLGGPWERLPSPTKSTFSQENDQSPTKSMFSEGSFKGRAESTYSTHTVVAPSLPDTMNDENWTPQIDWEFRSPRRFLSLKKRSMIGLQIEK